MTDRDPIRRGARGPAVPSSRADLCPRHADDRTDVEKAIDSLLDRELDSERARTLFNVLNNHPDATRELTSLQRAVETLAEPIQQPDFVASSLGRIDSTRGFVSTSGRLRVWTTRCALAASLLLLVGVGFAAQSVWPHTIGGVQAQPVTQLAHGVTTELDHAIVSATEAVQQAPETVANTLVERILITNHSGTVEPYNHVDSIQSDLSPTSTMLANVPSQHLKAETSHTFPVIHSIDASAEFSSGTPSPHWLAVSSSVSTVKQFWNDVATTRTRDAESTSLSAIELPHRASQSVNVDLPNPIGLAPIPKRDELFSKPILRLFAHD